MEDKENKGAGDGKAVTLDTVTEACARALGPAPATHGRTEGRKPYASETQDGYAVTVPDRGLAVNDALAAAAKELGMQCTDIRSDGFVTSANFRAGPGTQEDRLTPDHPAGTRGRFGGRAAVRIDLGGRKYLIALANEGADGETGFGDHVTYDEAVGRYPAKRGAQGPRGVWRLPTREEAGALASLCVARYIHTDGRAITPCMAIKVCEDAYARRFNLPAARSLYGEAPADDDGWEGSYWTSDAYDAENAYALAFDSWNMCTVVELTKEARRSVRLVAEL